MMLHRCTFLSTMDVVLAAFYELILLLSRSQQGHVTAVSFQDVVKSMHSCALGNLDTSVCNWYGDMFLFAQLQLRHVPGLACY